MATSTQETGTQFTLAREAYNEIVPFLTSQSGLTGLELMQDKHEKEYYNIPAAFDIEASSFYIDGEKRACMYLWMFGINGSVLYGRTWEQFVYTVNAIQDYFNLNPNRRMVVYVHNLGYDWQFFRKWIPMDKVFLLEERKPCYAISGGLEFRDSLVLSGGVSLAHIGNKMLHKYKVKKRVGDLDYELVRGPTTPLTETELGYGIADVQVLMAYIQEKIEQDGGITNIPLTNTGYVRRYARRACFQGVQEVQEGNGAIDFIA